MGFTRNVSFILLLQVLTVKILAQPVLPGACSFDQYVDLLKGKKVALLINQTSVVGTTLLPDTLLRRGVHLVKIFAPEHGLRGRADAGAEFNDEQDSVTGLPIVSLYGANRKPKKE